MAGNSAKKISQSNASYLDILTKTIFTVNAFYILYRIVLNWDSFTTRPLVGFVLNNSMTLLMMGQLKNASDTGLDLSGKGLVAYMQDIIYINIWTLITTALFSETFWWSYIVIPAYAIFKLGSKLLTPGSFGGLAVPNASSSSSSLKSSTGNKKEKKQKIKYVR